MAGEHAGDHQPALLRRYRPGDRNNVPRFDTNPERIRVDSDKLVNNSMMSARSSLAFARMAIERDRNLSDEQRTQALAGIAQAEAEVRGAN